MLNIRGKKDPHLFFFFTVLDPSLLREVNISESIFEKYFSSNGNKLIIFHITEILLAFGNSYVMKSCAFNEQ